LIKKFIDVRLAFYVKRKAHQLQELNKETLALTNKARFITEILENTLDLRRKKSSVIVELLKAHKYDRLENDEEFKYLVRMPMDSVTEENVEKLLKERDQKCLELEKITKTSEASIWLDELSTLKKEYLLCLGKKNDIKNDTTTKPKVKKENAEKKKVVKLIKK
jgi:DNA topoisomerase-2